MLRGLRRTHLRRGRPAAFPAADFAISQHFNAIPQTEGLRRRPDRRRPWRCLDQPRNPVHQKTYPSGVHDYGCAQSQQWQDACNNAGRYCFRGFSHDTKPLPSMSGAFGMLHGLKNVTQRTKWARRRALADTPSMELDRASVKILCTAIPLLGGRDSIWESVLKVVETRDHSLDARCIHSARINIRRLPGLSSLSRPSRRQIP
jgi:hypothetical protein